MDFSASDGSEPAPNQDIYASEFKPIGATWYFRINSTGEILEVDALVVRTEDWAARREAKDPSWRPVDFGKLTLAVKTLC
jgi:hypothetical protein